MRSARARAALGGQTGYVHRIPFLRGVTRGVVTVTSRPGPRHAPERKRRNTMTAARRRSLPSRDSTRPRRPRASVKGGT
ncbi:hypothetical protein L837_1702 [Mycobacterium avium MAV_061107_1842]|uniref:Uncharacterized protein n=1 Tax=Mycobacterium avium (strain 104) TaxID=243243 RepID=A0A0H2ZZF9_MYCA1|nr:hypothetical protein MAV_3345 [Mycobacterium avium 104]ETZ50934.1 hypothetical protein L837_1702 [Mycobacterium avium MAV_061107_1842]